MTKMSKRRLHPIAILINFVLTLRHLYLAIIIGFVTFRGLSLLYFLLITLAILIPVLLYSFLSWFRFTYKVENNELQIHHGIFIRKERHISKNRIQSIDLTASIIHRLFKLVKVQIDTAGSGEGAEASLSAVKLADGEKLRADLKMSEQKLIDEEQPIPNEPSSTITFKRLFLAGSTSGSIGVILAIVLFGFSEVEQFIPNQFYDNTLQWIIGLSIILLIGLVVIGLFILWIIGIAGTMIKYGNFTITKKNDELFITRGLLEKREQTIPLRRIQAVGIKESIIRQPLGFVTVFAEVAGGSMDSNEEFNILFPIMKKSEVEHFLQTYLPAYVGITEEFQHLPKQSLKYYLIRSVTPVLLLSVGLWYFFPKFILMSIVLIVASIFLGLLRYKDAGYRLGKNRLTIVYRQLLSKTTMIIYKKRIQSFERKQHIIQKMDDLATMHIAIIGVLGLGTHYNIKDMDTEDIYVIANWYR